MLHTQNVLFNHNTQNVFWGFTHIKLSLIEVLLSLPLKMYVRSLVCANTYIFLCITANSYRLSIRGQKMHQTATVSFSFHPKPGRRSHDQISRSSSNRYYTLIIIYILRSYIYWYIRRVLVTFLYKNTFSKILFS